MLETRLFGTGLIAGMILLALAGPAGAAPLGADSPEAQEILEQLGERYETRVLEDAYVVKASAGGGELYFIEVRSGSVMLDGEPVDRDALREKFGDDGDLMYSLSEIVTVELEEFPDDPAELEIPAVRPTVETDNRVSFGSSMTVEANEIARDVVVIGGSLEILGEVRGDTVVVGGSVEVRGKVEGTVTAVGGSVMLGPDARIDGDVSAIGGRIESESGAQIRGDTTELSFGDWGGPWDSGWDWDWDFEPWWTGWGDGWFDWIDLVERIVTTGMLCVFVFFLVLIARGYVTSIADRARREPWKAGLVGLIAEILFVPVLVVVFIVLMVSIIGIPLALIMVPASILGIVILFLVGYSGVATLAGTLLGERFRLGPLGPFMAALLGIALIQSWSILGETLSFVGGPLHVAAWTLLLTGFLIKYLAWTVGLGSVLLHGFSPLPARAVGGAALPPPVPPSLYPPPPPPSPQFFPERDPQEDRIYREAGQAPAGGPSGAEEHRGSPAPGAGPPLDDDELYREAGSRPPAGKRSQG